MHTGLPGGPKERTGDDVTPLVAAAGLHAHAVVPVQVHEVGALPALMDDIYAHTRRVGAKIRQCWHCELSAGLRRRQGTRVAQRIESAGIKA